MKALLNFQTSPWQVVQVVSWSKFLKKKFNASTNVPDMFLTWQPIEADDGPQARMAFFLACVHPRPTMTIWDRAAFQEPLCCPKAFLFDCGVHVWGGEMQKMMNSWADNIWGEPYQLWIDIPSQCQHAICWWNATCGELHSVDDAIASSPSWPLQSRGHLGPCPLWGPPAYHSMRTRSHTVFPAAWSHQPHLLRYAIAVVMLECPVR